MIAVISVDDPHRLIEDIALRLTGSSEFQCDSYWNLIPPNWSCPVCKRSKFHIARPNKHGVLQGNVANHHDHIVEYAKLQAKSIVADAEPPRKISEREVWFIREKIGSFLSRFDKTLICEDCNNADTKAKSLSQGTCRYFSFSPGEIARLIRPEAHHPHKVDEQAASEILNDKLIESHEYRKALCNVLVIRSLENERIWAEPSTAPNIEHYKAAISVLNHPELFDGSVILNLVNRSDANLRYLSIAVEKNETKRHERSARPGEENWEKKQRKKERLRNRREETESLVASGVYFNHGKPWTSEMRKALAQDYDDGATIPELAVRFGRAAKSIKSRLRKLGYTID